jgi:type II secretory pathway pseudopilin PulG
MAILGVLAALAVPRVGGALDRAGVRGAVTEIETAFASARSAAIGRQRRITVDIRDDSAIVMVRSSRDTLHVRRLGAVYGVTLTSTRATMSYLPAGLAWGAANLSIVVRRGAVVDTVVVSRLGRVRS